MKVKRGSMISAPPPEYNEDIQEPEEPQNSCVVDLCRVERRDTEIVMKIYLL